MAHTESFQAFHHGIPSSGLVFCGWELKRSDLCKANKLCMKIGIVCYPTFGGSGVLATELGKALAQNGHEIHFITYDRPVRLDFFQERVYYHEVKTEEYPLFQYSHYESALTSKLVYICKYNQLDLLHVHYAIPHASSAFLAREILKSMGIHIPFITTLHGTDITLVGKEESYQPVVEFSINQSDAVTCVSDYLKQATLENFKISREICVITNFVDLKRFQHKNREPFRKMISPNGEKLILHASNFRKVKRVEDVVLVFEQIVQKVPSKLIMIGDGPERTHAERMVRDRCIANHVIFLGKQEQVEEILPLGDLFLLPSETESFGLAALEAMACGVPVIGSDTGGLPEVVFQGNNGYLCPVGDIDGMSKHAIEVLLNPALQEQLVSGAKETANHFRLETILPLYELLYQRVLQGKHGLCE